MADKHSYANHSSVQTTSLHFEVAVDFDKQKITGFVDIRFRVVQPTSTVVLDTKKLVIHNVEEVSAGHTTRKFTVGPHHEAFGSALAVDLGSTHAVGSHILLRVSYETTPEGSAAQYLTVAQTKDKKLPFLFTQCEAIHARSLLPCQDSPAIKAPWSASVHVPFADMTVVMSGVKQSDTVEKNGRTFQWHQTVPVPSYLIAIAAGDLAFQPLGDGKRCGVWAERSIVNAAATEFGPHVLRFLEVGEELLHPYDWGRYDVLVLPPSFPIGGMENPCMTFATPTILAGDGSLMNIIAHECAHSWTGNLVTNKTWEDFWLNEGFTVFLERKIVEKVYGSAVAALQSLIGEKDLLDELETFQSTGKGELTALVPPMDGVDPDDAFSSVPYEKGYNFLVYLERLVGGDAVFNAFLKTYIKTYARKSLDTKEWRQFFLDYFTKTHPVKEEVLKSIDWDAWFYKPGLLPVKNTFEATLVNSTLALVEVWTKKGGAGAEDISSWSSVQKIYFLDKLLEAGKELQPQAVRDLGARYGFANTTNNEIRFRWLSLCLQHNFEDCFDAVCLMLTSQGRMKFTRPLYRSLAKCGHAGLTRARNLFAQNKEFYHPIARKQIAGDLEKAHEQ